MLISELDDLLSIDIQFDDIFNTNNQLEIIETILILMDEYYESNVKYMHEVDFHEEMIINVTELIEETMSNLDLFEVDKEDLEDLINIADDIFFSIKLPRCCGITRECDVIDRRKVKSTLKNLKETYQPDQRTNEWYKYRHDMITASNAYKAIDTESCKNQLIAEKCKPLKIQESNQENEFVNTETTLHWGQKYEPLSVLIYEEIYQTKIDDFGCIQHPKYNFIGASPDGINADSTSKRYGRMLEIKNIVNRTIDGNPKKEYWVQMQLQMEVCDLNECDFLETRFVEYDSEKQFYEEYNFDGTKFGVICYLHNTITNKPEYVYKPLSILEKDEIESWLENTMKEGEEKKYIWIRNIFWKLEEFSCVLVLRQQEWFTQNIDEMKKLWDEVIKRRNENTCDFPTKKQNKLPEKSVCLIEIKKNDTISHEKYLIPESKDDLNISINTETKKERKMTL